MRYVQWLFFPVLLLGTVLYANGEVSTLRGLEQGWYNTQDMDSFLRNHVRASDKVLYLCWEIP